MTNYFIENKETGKLELHFDRETYAALSEEQKSEIKRAFLWGRRSGCWISRSKTPNLWQPRLLAEQLVLSDAGHTGERLSFAEQQERKQERAARRAERYDARAEAAERRVEALQAPIEAMRGDIAFHTQPNIDSSAGRAFSRKRARMWAAWERGIDELRKSEYWQERAEIARHTAAAAELTDKGFISRRIADREASLRKLGSRAKEYAGFLAAIDAGNTPRNAYGWEVRLSRDDIEKQLAIDEDRIEALIDELAYYQAALDALGGVTFSRENLKPGDLLTIGRYREPVRYVRGGTKNFTYEFTVPHMTYADGSPMRGQAAFAEITGRAE